MCYLRPNTHTHTLSSSHRDMHTLVHVHANKRLYRHNLDFVESKVEKPILVMGFGGRGLRGAKMSSHPSISTTTVILPLQDLHTNFTAMLLKCLQSFHILQWYAQKNSTDRFKVTVAEHYCSTTTAYLYMLYSWFLWTDGECSELERFNHLYKAFVIL